MSDTTIDTQIESLVERLAEIEHERWSDWQAWCHKILRENCPSPELEAVLERGHNPDPLRGATMTATYGAVPKYVCVYCGTTFWTTNKTTEHEENPPQPDQLKGNKEG